MADTEQGPKERVIEAMRLLDHEINGDMSVTEANILLIEAIHEKLQRLDERVSFLEPYEED